MRFYLHLQIYSLLYRAASMAPSSVHSIGVASPAKHQTISGGCPSFQAVASATTASE